MQRAQMTTGQANGTRNRQPTCDGTGTFLEAWYASYRALASLTACFSLCSTCSTVCPPHMLQYACWAGCKRWCACASKQVYARRLITLMTSLPLQAKPRSEQRKDSPEASALRSWCRPRPPTDSCRRRGMSAPTAAAAQLQRSSFSGST